MMALLGVFSVASFVRGYDYSNLQYLQTTPTPVTIPESAADADLNAFFSGADADKDGFLTKEEVKAYYTANNEAIADADLDAAFTKADTDADGKISSAELRAYIPAPVTNPPTTDPSTTENKTESTNSTTGNTET